MFGVFVRANPGIVGSTWFIWRAVELRYWKEHGNVKNENKLVGLSVLI